MDHSRETLAHVAALFDTLYRVLGENAPLVGDDSYVVRLYEMARSTGDVVLLMREHLGGGALDQHAALEDVLRRAFRNDESGAMALFALASVVGPRILVTLRDANLEFDLDRDVATLLVDASSVLVRQLMLVGETVSERAPIEDLHWRGQARELDELLERSENAESFRFSR
jgi:hypothetical protein